MAAIVAADEALATAPYDEDGELPPRFLAAHEAAIAAAEAAYAATIAPFQAQIDGWKAMVAEEAAEFALVGE